MSQTDVMDALVYMISFFFIEMQLNKSHQSVIALVIPDFTFLNEFTYLRGVCYRFFFNLQRNGHGLSACKHSEIG